jgi:hypothetical protein
MDVMPCSLLDLAEEASITKITAACTFVTINQSITAVIFIGTAMRT